MPRKKDKAAVSLGRRGGKKRARNLSREVRSSQARNAANIRWARYRAEKAKTV